jgi:hypothetical protein
MQIPYAHDQRLTPIVVGLQVWKNNAKIIIFNGHMMKVLQRKNALNKMYYIATKLQAKTQGQK